MSDETHPVYLERDSYLRRRIADVACLAPVFGLGLMVLPALWASESRTAAAMIYVFTAWLLLILLMAFVSRRLSVSTSSDQAPTDTLEQEQ